MLFGNLQFANLQGILYDLNIKKYKNFVRRSYPKRNDLFALGKGGLTNVKIFLKASLALILSNGLLDSGSFTYVFFAIICLFPIPLYELEHTKS